MNLFDIVTEIQFKYKMTAEETGNLYCAIGHAIQAGRSDINRHYFNTLDRIQARLLIDDGECNNCGMQNTQKDLGIQEVVNEGFKYLNETK